MRGSQKLANAFKPQPLHKRLKKGRDSNYIDKRNTAMVNRFYFFSVFLDWKYEKVINILSIEFYLAPSTITQIIMKQYHLITKVRKIAPNIKQLRDTFPTFNWDLKSFQAS